MGSHTCIQNLLQLSTMTSMRMLLLMLSDNEKNIFLFRSNILLDDKLNAQISDFGFSIQMPQNVHGTTLITATDGLPGTSGYRPPEFSDCKYSIKSDVYSFCVVSLFVFSFKCSDYINFFPQCRWFLRPIRVY